MNEMKIEKDRFEHALVIAFVQGAQFWEFYKENATMWNSDKQICEDEAMARLDEGTLGSLLKKYGDDAELMFNKFLKSKKSMNIL